MRVYRWPLFLPMVEAHVQFVISPASRERSPRLVADFGAGLTRCARDPSAAVAVKAATVKMAPEQEPAVAAGTPADIAAPSWMETPQASMELPVESLEFCYQILGGSLHDRPSQVLFSSVLRASLVAGLQRWLLIADGHHVQNLIDTRLAVRY